jgi:hypothetical protein
MALSILWSVLVHAVTRFHKRRNLLTSPAVIRFPRKLHAIIEFSTLGAFASSRSSVRLSVCMQISTWKRCKASWFFHIVKFYQTHNQQVKLSSQFSIMSDNCENLTWTPTWFSRFSPCMSRTMVFLLCAYAVAVTVWTHRKFRKTNSHVLSFKFCVPGMYIASI